MNKTPMRALSALAAAAIFTMAAGARSATRDISYGFRAPGGIPGDVNRSHPVEIEPAGPNVTNPPDLYGCALLVDTATNTVRKMLAGDTAITRIYGILARAYPVQQSSGANYGAATIGSAAPPTNQALDVCKEGYIMARVNGSPTKDGAVFVWVAASSGNHIQGTFEAAATGGSTAAITNARFNGPPDASGNVEIIVYKQ